jgi:hypothetical protein
LLNQPFVVFALVVGCGTNDGKSASTGGAGGSVMTGGGGSGGASPTASGGGGSFPDQDASDGATACPSPPTGAKAAPCGYYVEGNKVRSVFGASEHLFHGVARPSLEWSAFGEAVGPADADVMKTWKVNTVRFALNQGYWLPGTTNYVASYKNRIDVVIGTYEARGFDVILDLHWNASPPAGSNSSGQQNGPDARSVTFWSEIAAAYKNDGHVLFELYNEPHDLSDDAWYSGMSGLYNAVRSAGADNLVIIGGLDWAYDLTVMNRRPITGYNIMLASHPYQDKQDMAGKVDVLAARYPIIFTEFGDRSGSCSTGTVTNVINHANQMGYSWTAWAWYPQTGTSACTFPSLISDWNGTPTAQGTVARTALLAY